ncbi:aureocin A53 family class IId bacteriocin [Exiguobacterium sp. s191]
MATFLELVRTLPYRASLWVVSHKDEVLKLIKNGASLTYLVRYVISKVY